MDRLDFDGFDETDFEEFCFELLSGLDGFRNVDWRKGTPKPASPAYRGRDIVAEVERTDVDGAKHIETWFIDCKHYSRGVPPEALQGLLTWASAERPHVALVIVSGYLSNPSKDFLRAYEQNNRPAFRIKYWERPILDKLTRGNRALLDRFVVGGIRSQSEIIAAEEEFLDRRWYDRHLMRKAGIESGRITNIPPELWEQALKAAEEIKERRPNLRPVQDDFEWGMWCGKHSALRWVLGDEWDNLDT
jgi:hypothetical protein